MTYNITALRSRADRIRASNPAMPKYVSYRPGADAYKTIGSLATSYCNTEVKERNTYTGSVIIGIATTHKSNAVPVSSIEQATDIAHMRR